MDDSEKISGKKIFDILEQLKKNHTIMNIHVMGTNFDGLSIILGVSEGDHPRFFIDYPGSPDSIVPITVGKKCYFEFNDEDKIKYSFSTTVDSIFGKRIKFKFPEFIVRAQRRRTFRIPAPSGSMLFFPNSNDQYNFDVINVSEGGLLVSHRAAYHDSGVLYKGNKLERLVLSSEQEDITARIDIQSAEIVRVEKTDDSDRINYGLRFTGVDKREMGELKKFIYYCQRKVLKRRGEMDG